MICPKCEYEYHRGMSVCPDCGEELVTNKEFEGHLVHPKDWVIVYSCADSIEANMLKSNLEGAEIEVLILNQNDSSFPGVGDLSIIKILTKRVDAEDAIAIISDINKED
ncbi:MAG: DUF2007 domain-containing protein [Bacteroidetes bacterium]|nr:DUF2007 domain-containing protein [Bacteroidota bacterium]MBU1114260.1 DUF2007 domain-containing protein [Bacteroidota bacterium]MBU1797676.1 DUF2007 domain-containing protein [Bacteroidota bacterium]